MGQYKFKKGDRVINTVHYGVAHISVPVGAIGTVDEDNSVSPWVKFDNPAYNIDGCIAMCQAHLDRHVDLKHCNHHHELTDQHTVVDFGSGEFVANNAAIPLLKALNEAGLMTRTHHHDGGSDSFIGILMDNVSIEVHKVHERDATRTEFNGKTELLISWHNGGRPENG